MPVSHAATRDFMLLCIQSVTSSVKVVAHRLLSLLYSRAMAHKL